MKTRRGAEEADEAEEVKQGLDGIGNKRCGVTFSGWG